MARLRVVGPRRIKALAFLLLGWLWGIPGMFFAVPLLVTLKVICDHVGHFATFGEYLGRD